MTLCKLVMYATTLFAVLGGCGKVQHGTERNTAHLNDLADNRGARNIAVIVGAPTDLPGIDLDLNMMNEVLAAPKGAFEVRRSWKESSSQIIARVRQAAMDVGDDGTLFFFFSGHGAQNGLLLAQSGGMLNFDDITKAIKEARSKPLKRFMVVVDACFSGNLVNGTVAVGRQDNPEATIVALRGDDNESHASAYSMEKRAAVDALNETMVDVVSKSITGEDASYAAPLTEQLLVIAAANRSTTSLAGGDGSTFTKGLWQAFRDMAQDSGATIRTFLKKVHDNTRRNSGGHHTPVYRVYPEKEVLDDLLTESSNTTNPGTPDLAVALSEVNANGEARVYVAADSGVTNIMICRGSREACLAAPTAAIAVVGSQKVISGRKVFESETSLALPENQAFTIIGRGGTNGDSVLAATTVQFRAK